MARFAANLTMMFTELPFMERFGAAARAGFRAVEYMLPYAHEAAAIRAELDAHGLEQALFNTPPGDWEKGARGAAAIDGEGALFPAHLAQALDYAAVIRPKNIHVMAGVGEGDDDIFEDNLRVACAAAPEQGFVIEPINTRDMPGYYLHSTAHAARMIERVGAPNLGLQLDLYHCQIMEGDLTRRIEALAPLIAHVQIAGVPERHEPDAGEFSLPHVLRTLERVGYDGFIGCEYRPAGRTEDGLGWFAPYRN